MSTGSRCRGGGLRAQVRTISVMTVAKLLATQDGVIARRQALTAGETPLSIARLLRRREWVAVHPGVYVNHTGALTWQQRAWAAVLAAGPRAALCLESASACSRGQGTQGHRRGRHPRRRRPQALTRRARRGTDPPGVGPGRPGAVEPEPTPDPLRGHGPRPRRPRHVTDVGRSPGRRVREPAYDGGPAAAEKLDARSRIAQRAWLRSVLSDVADGTCSVLEHGYLDLVERPHGLPVGQRQAPRHGSNGRVYCDVGPSRPRRQGRAGRQAVPHVDTEDRDQDMERDLDAAVDGTAADAADRLRPGLRATVRDSGQARHRHAAARLGRGGHDV